MKILQNVIQKNGFIYKQVKRDERRAVYSQHFDCQSSPVAFEVFKVIKVGDKKRLLPDGREVLYREHERFPSNEDFGKTAWTYGNIGEAELKYRELGEKNVRNK